MFRSILILFFSVAIFSCKKNNSETPIDECTVDITHQLRNPYEMSTGTMLTGKKPTHYYVKFHIYDIAQFRALEAKGIVLLNHPFDAVPDKNLEYKTEHTKQYGVYYGVVPANFNLSSYEVEMISNLDMSTENSAGKTKSKHEKTFAGTITFFDPIDSLQTPLKGVQVIIKDATKTANVITDDLGNFSLTSSEITADTVEVLLKFDNDYIEIHTLDVNNLFDVFGINTFSLGFKKSCAFTNLNIEIGRQFNNAALHHSCAALYSLNKYKEFAAHYGLLMPDKKFLFWLGKEAPISTSYATPMLRNMNTQNVTNTNQLLTNLIGIPSELAGVLAFIVKDQLPDVYAPFYVRYSTAARASFIETLFHELSHASHYAKVGPAFWLPYVEYIYGNGGYGEPAFANSGMIALSEAWAEDLSNIGLNYIYGKQKYLDYNENPVQDWIPYGLYYDLFDTGTNESFDAVSGINFTQLYGFLTTDNRDPATLKARLKASYPTQQTAIEVLFNHYGF